MKKKPGNRGFDLGREGQTGWIIQASQKEGQPNPSGKPPLPKGGSGTAPPKGERPTQNKSK